MYIKYALKLKINRTFIEILSHLLYDRTDIFRRSQVAQALLQKKPSKPSAEKQRKLAVPFAWEAGGPARGSSSLMERGGPPSPAFFGFGMRALEARADMYDMAAQAHTAY